MAPTDRELVARVRDGDEDAFRMLFDRYNRLVRARIRQWLPNGIRRRISISDLVQEARLAAFQGCHDLELAHDGAFQPWLLRIVEHKVRDAIRRQASAKRDAGREVSRHQRDETAQARARGLSPSEHAIAAEDKARMMSVLDALPPDYREILRLARLEGLTLREAGERMGRSREAAKKLYARALARFTELYRETGGQP